jgi:hypothetical protein
VRIDKGRRTESTFRVSIYETDRRVEFRGVSEPYLVRYDLEAIAASTRLTFTFELSNLELYMRPFEKLIRAAANQGAVRVVRRLKELIETETTAAPR